MNKSVRTPQRIGVKGAIIGAAVLAAVYAATSYRPAADQPEAPLPEAGPQAASPAVEPSAPAETAAAAPQADETGFDTSRLPRTAGASQLYASPATTIFISQDSVSKTAETLASDLGRAGWQRYEVVRSFGYEEFRRRLG